MKYSTKEFFPLFKKEVEYWLNFFGLKRYSIFIDLDEDKEGMDTDAGYVRAHTFATLESMTARICLVEMWGDTPTERGIKGAAFHEVCELLFWRLYEVSLIDSLQKESRLIEERHAIINTFEDIFFKKGE